MTTLVPLCHRREINDLVLFYNFNHKLCDVNVLGYVTFTQQGSFHKKHFGHITIVCQSAKQN